MSTSSPRTVRYVSRSYGYERVCYGLPVADTQFICARTVPVRRLVPRSAFWNAARLFTPRSRDLVHSFNDLIIGAKTWVVSHELELPRFLLSATDAHMRKAYDLLAADSCRMILPMSDAAKAWMLRRAPNSCASALAAKTRVFTDGVNGPEHYGLTPSPRERAPDEPLKLVFVGNNAFRKGGQYVLDAFDSLRANSVNVELTFIGNVDPYSYVLPVTPEAHAKFVKRLQETVGVTWIRRAPNREVLATMTASHVGLLPTLDDSLGWSVIEMMSAGLPVIASNIVAIPEMVEDGVTGRLIELPRDEDRRWVGVSEARGDADVATEAHDRLVTGMANAIAEFDADESLRLRMGLAGRSRYEAQFTPMHAASLLAEIYSSAMGG